MISNENILELETRRHIYNIILNYPGLHLRELSRKSDSQKDSTKKKIFVKTQYSLINAPIIERE